MGSKRIPQTKKLFLMRHAKSDWNDSSLSDKARPLNDRGRADAPRMANWLIDNQYTPNGILCSSAVRTRQTLALMQNVWREHKCEWNESKLAFEDSLYLASAESILSIACNACSQMECSHCLVLGHNPGMEELASMLGNNLIDMPTAAIVVFESRDSDWPEDWSSVEAWNLREMVKPRDLGSGSL